MSIKDHTELKFSEEQHLNTLEISNSITGIFLELGSIKWRRNLGVPKVRESMSSEATAKTYDIISLMN